MKRTQVVLFDLDETLFDHAHASHVALSQVWAKYPHLQSQALEDIETHLREVLDEFHQRVLVGELSLKQARELRFGAVLTFCGNEANSVFAAELAREFRTVYQQERRPVEGSIQLLNRLRGAIKVGIVTNSITQEQQDKLHYCGLENLIDFLITSEDAGVSKPDSRIFEVALCQAGCQADEAIMVGDSWRDDVLGARGCGIRAIWFNRSGLPCPDPGMVSEISSFQPVDQVVSLLLGASGERKPLAETTRSAGN